MGLGWKIKEKLIKFFPKIALQTKWLEIGS